MKTVLFLLLVLSCSAHAAQPVINAPQPVLQPNVMGFTDYALAGGLVLGRALDFTSTSECIRTTQRSGCHEEILPNVLVHNKTAFIGFEVGAASLEILSEYELRKHGHKRLARVVAGADISTALLVDWHNYKLARVR